MTVPGIAFRLAQRADVPAILAILPDLSPDPAEVRAKLPTLDQGYAIFERMQRHGNVHIVLACLPEPGAVIGSCLVVIVPNFTYGKPWAIIENVVIAATHQGRGIGDALMAHAFDFAERQGCYKAQLLSGPDERQIRFYRQVGMDDGHCHGFKKWFIAP